MKKNRIVAALILFTLLSSAGLAGPEQEKGTSKSFAVGKGGALDVSVTSGTIRVSGWEKDEVFVRISGVDAEDLAGVEITQEGKTVRVRDRSARGNLSDMRVSVNVPSQFDVDIRTSAGDIELEGPLTGDLRGVTAGGDLRLGNLGGKLKMSTSGGDVKAGNFQGDLSVSTSGGDISIGKITGEGEVATSGGEIEVGDVGKRMQATTSGGNVKVGDVGGDVKVSTAGGDVRVGKIAGNARLSTAGGNVELRGANGSVSAKTAGGNLVLEGITGSVDGSTAGGNVDAWLNPGKNGRSKLTTAGGDIRLQVTENAKVTIEARISLDRYNKHKGDLYDIRSDFKIENLKRDEREIRGTINLNGGGDVVTLETVMGNIEIRKAK